ncbi:MAG: hypothetical protein Q8M31_24080, partial [Beijerinckiaceae bacterium]|nr:hypothetical protein [Beijerinckiaceae bacterium]
MDSLTAQMPSAAPIEVPRSLIQNPFSNEIEGFDFETRVQWAISGSLRHGRVLGVIHFGFSTGGADVGPASLKLLNIRMIAIQKELKARLRSGDCVKITGEGKISVIIPLLALRPDLERIADRLYVVALKAGAELELPLAYAPGCAMYPIDGYSFAELSQAAEDRASFAVVPDVQRFSVPETANAGEQFLSSALVCERVCASPTNPRLAVIQYPRALEDEPARRLIVADALPEPVPPTGIVQQQSFSASLPSVTEPSCSAKPFIWRRFFRDAPQRVRRFICASKTRLSTTRLP